MNSRIQKKYEKLTMNEKNDENLLWMLIIII
mgnify:CR=1 FL=1